MTIGKTLIAAIACFAATPAWAVSFDFEPPITSFVSLTSYGVTFTAGGQLVSVVPSPNGTSGLLTTGSPRPVLRADFLFEATSVAVDLGDFGVDADTLFLEVYDINDVLLGSSTLLTSADDMAMHRLSVTGSDIRYALFGGRAPALNGSSVYADNFTVEPQLPSVPEPGSWALLIAGFGAVGGALRRRLRVPRPV